MTNVGTALILDAITVNAAKGSTVHKAFSEAMVLCYKEGVTVLLTHNTTVFRLTTATINKAVEDLMQACKLGAEPGDTYGDT